LPIAVFSRIALTRPLGFGNRKLDPQTVTVLSILFATADFVDDPGHQHRNTAI
jgi:hypothetical protein